MTDPGCSSICVLHPRMRVPARLLARLPAGLLAVCWLSCTWGCATERAWLAERLAPDTVARPANDAISDQLPPEQTDGPVAEVQLTGIDREDLDPLPLPLPCNAKVWRAERSESEWREAITMARRRAGDYTPTIDARIRSPISEAKSADATQSPACWRLQFSVKPGSAVTVRALRVALLDNSDPVLTELVLAPPLREGRVFSETRYESLKGALSRMAEEHGYFDARFTEHQVDVYPEEAVADVALVFAPGRQYAFGPLLITPSTLPLKQQFIARMAPFEAGDPYLSSQVDLLRSRLTESGYFSAIDVHPEPDAAVDGKVPMRVDLTPLPRLATTVGAGFATDIGPRGQLSFENRFVNDTGDQAIGQIKVSPVISDASLAYRIPSNQPAERWWTLDLGAKRERTDTADADSLTLGVRNISLQTDGWRRTLAIDLTRERFAVGADNGRSLLLVPSVRFERSVRTRNSQAIDNVQGTGSALDTGWRVAAVVSGAHAQLLSDVSFLQVQLEGRLAFAAGRRARVLTRLEGGTSWVSGFAELPPSFRLYAGGDDSVRGYDFKSLGPRDNQNKVRGGRHRVTASLEYERLFTNAWSWAIFADAGNTFDELPAPVRAGVGMGVRWQTPVGSVRIDLAHPLSGSDQAVRLHIGIGRVQ